jgi:Zn-dependent peptidase ImmA (M78 family)/DNA-binding XRE family transcriptional regulator
MAKGWSMVDLARQIEVSRQAISSFEKGEKNPSYETMREMAKVLDVKDNFFFLPDNEWGLKKESAINFRTLKSAFAKEIDQAKVYLNWFAELCYLLESDYVEFQPVKLPKFDIDDFETLTEEAIEYYAEQTRRFFGLGDGPISDLTLLLENNGVFIGYLPLPQKIDGISFWINKRPYVLINRGAYACRARFDLAHELGHLVLHTSLAQEDLDKKEILDLVEKQANLFSSAFLVPEKAIAQEFYSTDLNALKDLKKRWGVSMQALVMRLHSIDLVSDSQKRYFFQKIATMGYRKKEPLDDVMVKEESRTIKRIIELLNSKSVLLASEFLTKFSFPIAKALSGLPDDFFIAKERENNVVKLRLAN